MCNFFTSVTSPKFSLPFHSRLSALFSWNFFLCLLRTPETCCLLSSFGSSALKHLMYPIGSWNSHFCRPKCVMTKDLRSTDSSHVHKKKKKKNRSLDRDTGTVFGRNLSFFPNALHSVLLSRVSLNAIVKSGWVGLKLGVLSDFDHRGSSKCSQTRRHGREMTRMND